MYSNGRSELLATQLHCSHFYQHTLVILVLELVALDSKKNERSVSAPRFKPCQVPKFLPSGSVDKFATVLLVAKRLLKRLA